MVKGKEAESGGKTAHLTRVAFIGLGVMGHPMASNVLRSGFPLTVYSRARASADKLVAQGALRAASPAQAISNSDVLITMLPGADQVESVLFGHNGVASAARPGQLVIDMSSIDPGKAREFAHRLADLSVDFLDAPVSGGETGAQQATLSIMVGGTEEALARALPVMSVMGQRIVHVGESGSGQIAKACNQLVVLCNIQSVAEALVLAERAGVNPAVVRDALLGGFADSQVLQIHGQRMLTSDYQPGARSALQLKDVQTVRDIARRNGVPLALFEVAAGSLEALVASGGGALDHAALYTAVRAKAFDSAVAPDS